VIALQAALRMLSAAAQTAEAPAAGGRRRVGGAAGEEADIVGPAFSGSQGH
jgi:hypothetical protein